MTKKVLILLVSILILRSAVSLAAEDNSTEPNAGTQKTVENRDYYRLEQEILDQEDQEESNVIDHTAKQESEAPDSTTMILVQKIVVETSAILSDEEIAAITGKYEGRSVGIKELYQMLKEINNLYITKGFITAKAILPPQKIKEGIVHIKLVEAHFGQVLLEGNKYTRSSYILKRLSEHEGDLVNIKSLEQDLFYFNQTNDVQLKAELKPGKEFGLTDCVLSVVEPKNIQATLFTENGGSVNTGQYRLGSTFLVGSLFGYRDFLVVSPLWAEGTWAGSISYSMPVNRRGARLGYSYSTNQSSVIAGPFERLDIKSDETDIGLSLSSPIIVKPNFKFDGYASAYHKKAGTDFFNNTLIDYQVDTLSLGVDFQNVDRGGFWYQRYDITKGSSDSGDFYRFNFTTVRQQVVGRDQRLICRLTGQLTDDHLLPSTEAFSIGGMTTVRGYSNGLLSGDKGYVLSAEYNFPMHFLKSNKMNGLVFIDHGGTFPFKGNNESTSDHDYLTSTGFGVNFTCSKYLSGKIILGCPINAPEDEDGVKIHFILQSALF